VSLNGYDFATADFEPGFPVRDGYTMLDSSTGNIFMHMIQSSSSSAEFGSLYKSNLNGTFFHKLLDHVNQNRLGYVDFEKIEKLNGSIIANQVANVEGVLRGDSKQIITRISFDDGLII
jgi:hypothetical protein